MSTQLENVIRVGIVDGINDKEGTIRVTFPDRDDMVADDIALLDDSQNYPTIGDSVVCIFLPNGIQQGFCLGGYYHDQNPPPILDSNIYVKKIDEGLVIKYDFQSKKLTIDAQNEITINGNLRVTGQIIN
ncbi:MAG: hypothetical protein ACE3JQ_00245 [Paenisporosarcina sp.]